MHRTTCAVFGLLATLVATAGALHGRPKADGATLRVGLPRTFFHDVPDPLVKVIIEPFSTVIRDTAGTEGELVVVDDASSIARQLIDNKLQLAMMHGFEFGWVQQTHPTLRPLVVAIEDQKSSSAYVLVRKDSELTSFADLKGKELAQPRRTREHCRLFIEHRCRHDSGCGSTEYFKQVIGPANVEAALDGLCQGKIQAVLVDSIGLEFYKDLKPGCFARLKVLMESEPFPPPVVVYQQGALSDEVLGSLKNSLRGATKTEMGRELMKMWRLASFEPVPDTYGPAVAKCLKTYPSRDPKE